MRVTPLESDLVENKRYLYFLATNEGIQDSFTHQKNPTNLRNKNQERFAGHTSSEGVGQFHNSAQQRSIVILSYVVFIPFGSVPHDALLTINRL